MTTSALKTKSLCAALAALAALGLACTPSPQPEPLEPAPVIASFTSSAAEVAAGATVTLSWRVENAAEVRIDDVTLGSVSGVSGAEGSVEVAVGKATLFVLTARNGRGATDSAVVSVRVAGEPSGLLFTASPASVEAGQSVTLAWSAPGSTAVTITAAPGGAVDLGGQVESGSVTVRPTTTTTWTLSAGGRTATASVTVRAGIESFTATPTAVSDGGTVTLSWVTSNAERLQLLAPGRGTLADSIDGGMPATGSFSDTVPAVVDPGQLFPYELRATSGGATVSRTVIVSVMGVPAISSFTVPARVRQSSDGGTMLVSWQTVQSDGLSLSVGGTEVYRAPSQTAVTAGSTSLPIPTADTSLTLTATNSRGGTATRTQQLDVVGLPTVTLTATPSTITPGESFALNWAGTNVYNVRVYDDEGTQLYASSTPATMGTLPARAVTANTSYRVVVDNGFGDSAEATATVTVNGSLAFTQNTTGALRAGQNVELAWTFFSGAQALGLPQPNVAQRPGSTGFDDISTTGTPLSFSSSDDGVTVINPPDFQAPFFGRVVGDTVSVSTNGYLTFGYANPTNYTDVALPSRKLEPYSIAGYWDDLVLSSGTVYWQVKPSGAEKVLIVQWENVASSGLTFQIQVRTDGRVDLEYETMGAVAGRGGVQGPHGWGYAVTPASNLGVTFFPPASSPATVAPIAELPLTVFFKVNGVLVPVKHTFGTVLGPEDLSVSEAMLNPAPALGPAGMWFELYNARETAVDLTGWAVTQPDGGQAALSGTVPANGVLVTGASTDPALNDDAGVQVALTGLDLSPDGGTLSLGRDGPLSTWNWGPQPDAGTSVVSDQGPFRFTTATSLPQLCVSARTFGAQAPLQRGSPGLVEDCGFGYRWRVAPVNFRDISATGTKATLSSNDTATFTLDLTPAPFPFFGVSRTSARVSTNGFIAFDTATTNNSFSSAYPSATDSNLLIAVYGDDLDGDETDSAIYTQRIAPNADPRAPEGHWIVQWHDWTHYAAGDRLYFQAKLFDSGAVELHFGEMRSGSSSQYGAGTSAVTWLENAAGTQALTINANSDSPGIAPHTAYRFVPR